MTGPLSPWLCQHNHLSAPRVRQVRGGVQYRTQCLDCGRAVGGVIAKATALQQTGGQTAPFDEALFEAGQARAEEEASARAEEREAERKRWWAWYDDYLNSPEWRDRRRKVLERARGICEGCGERRAEHVHHKTYAHVGQELLFELAALCEQCHELAHSKNPTAMPEAMWLDRVAP